MFQPSELVNCMLMQRQLVLEELMIWYLLHHLAKMQPEIWEPNCWRDPLGSQNILLTFLVTTRSPKRRKWGKSHFSCLMKWWRFFCRETILQIFWTAVPCAKQVSSISQRWYNNLVLVMLWLWVCGLMAPPTILIGAKHWNACAWIFLDCPLPMQLLEFL